MARKNRQLSEPPSEPGPKWPIFAAVAIAGALIVFAIVRTTRTPGEAATSTVSSPAGELPPPVPAADTAATQPAETPSGLPPLASTRPQGAPFLPPGAEQKADPHTSETAEVARITPEELFPKYQARQVTIVDVRDAASYAGGHIEGALHIPFGSVEAEAPRLPKDKQIVFYCT